MHKWYPTRFPDELDGTDILRLLRMNDALEIMAVEDKNMAHINGDIKREDITKSEWAMILEHDRIVD